MMFVSKDSFALCMPSIKNLGILLFSFVIILEL